MSGVLYTTGPLRPGGVAQDLAPRRPRRDCCSRRSRAGNNLDGTPGTIRVLQSVALAVNSQIEIVLDGGVRRGSDVAKALALGARAVMIGRAYLWGLAANGQAGVENVFDILRNGLDSAVLGLGHSSIHELSPEDLYIPPTFSRTLGAGQR